MLKTKIKKLKKQTNRDAPRTEQGREHGPERLQTWGGRLQSRRGGASPGLGSLLLTIRASASPPLETETVYLPCFHVFHLCLFITFPQLSVHSFLLGFVILLHNLMSSLPLPGGHPCLPTSCPQLPLVSQTLWPLSPPEMNSSFFRTSLPGPLWSLLPSGQVLSTLLDLFLCVMGFLKYANRQSRTRDIWKTGAEDVPAGDRVLAG